MPIERAPNAIYVDDGQKPGCSGWKNDDTIVISSDDDKVRYYNLFYSDQLYSVVHPAQISRYIHPLNTALSHFAQLHL